MFCIKLAIFPGKFDPINNGQLDIIKKALKFFDKLIVLVLQNVKKKALFPVESRLNFIKSATLNFNNVEVDYWPKLLNEYINLCGACAIIRGVKNTTNFNKEINIATLTRTLNESVEVFFMLPNPKNIYINSKLVHRLCLAQKNLGSVVPKIVEQGIKKEV